MPAVSRARCGLNANFGYYSHSLDSICVLTLFLSAQLFVGLVVLAAAAGSPLCDPQCNTTVHAPYSVAPAVSICVAAATGQVHDFFDTHEESDTATGLGK